MSLRIWPGHRGDGPYAVSVGAAADPAGIDEAKKTGHDQVVTDTGARRAGPVEWLLFGPDYDEPAAAGLARLAYAGVEPAPGLTTYLEENPTAVLVVAMAPTDRTPQERRAHRAHLRSIQ